jgi:hypothetical protein
MKNYLDGRRQLVFKESTLSIGLFEKTVEIFYTGCSASLAPDAVLQELICLHHGFQRPGQRNSDGKHKA